MATSPASAAARGRHVGRIGWGVGDDDHRAAGDTGAPRKGWRNRIDAIRPICTCNTHNPAKAGKALMAAKPSGSRTPTNLFISSSTNQSI
jgi:hypothetical protein